eukprot:5373245-Prymnesium_polylepis.1
MPYFYKSPSGTSSDALGRRDFVRPEPSSSRCSTMRADPAGGMTYESRAAAGLYTVDLRVKKMGAAQCLGAVYHLLSPHPVPFPIQFSRVQSGVQIV